MEPTNPLMLKLQRYNEAEAFTFGAKQPTTPSEWFSMKFPTATMSFGTPFLERCYIVNGFNCLTVESINHDFFAALLGGDDRLNHKTVYYIPEATFYFRDNDNCFYPVDEVKLKLLVSALLMRCAEEMPGTVDRGSLIVECRADKHLTAIVKKARFVLAADASFFTADSPNQRVEGPETDKHVARCFAERVLERKPNERLTVQQTYEAFQRYCEQNGLVVVNRKAFKQLMGEVVREEYGIGIRNDLLDEQGKYHRGWTGLAVRNRLVDQRN